MDTEQIRIKTYKLYACPYLFEIETYTAQKRVRVRVRVATRTRTRLESKPL